MDRDTAFDPRALPRSFYDSKIKELRDEQRRLTDAALDIEDEIKWWLEGRDRFLPEADASAQPPLEGLDPPETPVDEPPNLPAKIRFVMSQDGSGPMKPAAVIDALDNRGWMPAAKTAAQMVRNRMLTMHTQGELTRNEPGGTYSLSARGAARAADDA